MSSRAKPALRPLLVREGARYTCFGDGLCCHDIHGLGPLTRKELVQVRKIDRNGAGWDDDFEDDMLRTAADGGCRFLLPNLLCGIHAEKGPEHKPHGCQKFPYGLTATPLGGRVYTEHRCPCRTMGDRPALTAEAAEASLKEGNGRLDSDSDVDRIRLDAKKSVSIEEWLSIEAPLLARLAAGQAPLEVLDARPFPKLVGARWTAIAQDFIDAKDGSRFGDAIAWFGDTVLHLVEGKAPRSPGRPWADAFDRAEARSPVARSSREVLDDWVADRLWSLKWADDGPFTLFRAEMATRVAIAESIASRLVVARGLRPDRAMAEAVMVVELVGASEHWETLVPKMRP